jgi:hypothetical protein
MLLVISVSELRAERRRGFAAWRVGAKLLQPVQRRQVELPRKKSRIYALS